jgi:type IV secretory pathway TrbD component
LLFWMLGRRGFDRRLAVVVLKSLAAAACALVLDRWLFPHLGFTRLFIGGAVYTVLAVATGAVDPREVLARGREAFAAKRARAAA